jgi:transcription initiation factor TFIIIB Brf1 subunit/transcription initiation factor TFIIB
MSVQQHIDSQGSNGLVYDMMEQANDISEFEALFGSNSTDACNNSYTQTRLETGSVNDIYEMDDNPFAMSDEDPDFIKLCTTEYIVNVEDDSYTRCCGTDMCNTENGYITCSVCGIAKVVYGDIGINHNESMIPHIQATGTKAYGYQKMLRISNPNDYAKMRSTYVNNILQRMNNAARNKIAIEILYQARMLCLEIMKKKTYRTKVLREIIASCIYHACIAAKQNRRPKEIAEFTGLDTDGFSQGDTIVIAMAELGVINITTNVDSTPEYIERAMVILNMDLRYKPFAVGIVKLAQHWHIAINSMAYSKSVGAVYLLAEANYPRISVDMIKDKLGIHINTIYKFVNEVKTHFRFFKDFYIKSGIPLPASLDIIPTKVSKRSRVPKKLKGTIKSVKDDPAIYTSVSRSMHPPQTVRPAPRPLSPPLMAPPPKPSRVTFDLDPPITLDINDIFIDANRQKANK